MNIRINTLEYANSLAQAGVARAHADAIANLVAQAITELVEHELVTKDYLRSELAVLKAELRNEFREDLRLEIDGLRREFRGEIDSLRKEFRGEIDGLRRELRGEIDALKVQLRALQYGGAIAAFAISAIVLLSRWIG
jgi:hypothetical protein